VAVIGSGRTRDPHCEAVGQLIASLGVDLLTGGGRGVMEAVSRAFFNSPRQGIVLGIIPARVHGLEQIEDRTAAVVDYDPPHGYPNEWVELPIYTHLPDSGQEGTLRSSRNHINVLTADALVAMPGREGTESEVWLAKQYGVPVMAYGNFTDSVPHGIPRARTIDALREFLVQHVAAPK
jgi:predicted Rossmann-fold nucleotide-binding protein